MPGLFITLEGGEGCGKTTQRAALAAALRQQGHTVLETREPGGSPAAEALRRTLISDPTCTGLDPLATGLVIAAGRRDHLTTVICPALAEGTIVLCDRYIDSTWAYQHFAEGLPAATVQTLIDLASSQAPVPHLTLLYDLPVAVARQRWQERAGGHDRYEGYADDYHERVRQGFLTRAVLEPQRIHVLNADQPAERLTEGGVKKILCFLDR
ncbi:MAG: dTMP kinase [Holosporales bacterium]|jgi:dTMP kinase